MTSFANDIAPMFAPYHDPMTWRLDLANYADVRFHANLILSMIVSTPGNPAQMPPPPFLPLPDEQVALFQQWQAEGYPE